MDKYRQQIIAQRQALSEQQKHQFGKVVCDHWLSTYANMPQSLHIGCYLAVRGEVSTNSIIEQLIALKHHCYLPRLADQVSNSMVFASYTPGDKLVQNDYHIFEPLPHTPVIHPAELDMVLVPLVLFDANGHRVGMGCGYYDRTFCFLQQIPRAKKPVLIGLAYSWQEIEKIMADPWDVSLDGVITELGIKRF